jgi:tetratricopeptide (TPR) repeat protein
MNPAIERKLRPIYDLIDSGDLKRALKQIKTLANKHNTPIVNSIRAYILQRLGQNDEAYQIVTALKAEKPTDSHVIDTLVLVFRGLGREAEAVDLYEVLFAQSPTEELEYNLLQAYLSM